jgi:hypothetical protein
MLVARIVLGAPYIASTMSSLDWQSLRTPPRADGGQHTPQDAHTWKPSSPQFYDSVLGESTQFGGDYLRYREFIIYHRSQLYPEFVVKYERSL